jgi:hypothetical protein
LTGWVTMEKTENEMVDGVAFEQAKSNVKEVHWQNLKSASTHTQTQNSVYRGVYLRVPLWRTWKHGFINSNFCKWQSNLYYTLKKYRCQMLSTFITNNTFWVKSVSSKVVVNTIPL